MTRRCRRSSRNAVRATAPAGDRLRVPGLQPAGRSDRERERVVAARARRRVAKGCACRRQSKRSRRSGSPTVPTGSPTNCPAANASASPSRVRSSVNVGCCSRTSPRARSTPPTARRSCGSSARTCQRGVAGVVVTHDAQLASWADRVVFLRDGRVVDQTSAAGRSRVAAGTRRSVMITLPAGLLRALLLCAAQEAGS